MDRPLLVASPRLFAFRGRAGEGGAKEAERKEQISFAGRARKGWKKGGEGREAEDASRSRDGERKENENEPFLRAYLRFRILRRGWYERSVYGHDVEEARKTDQSDAGSRGERYERRCEGEMETYPESPVARNRPFHLGSSVNNHSASAVSVHQLCTSNDSEKEKVE